MCQDTDWSCRPGRSLAYVCGLKGASHLRRNDVTDTFISFCRARHSIEPFIMHTSSSRDCGMGYPRKRWAARTSMVRGVSLAGGLD